MTDHDAIRAQTWSATIHGLPDRAAAEATWKVLLGDGSDIPPGITFSIALDAPAPSDEGLRAAAREAVLSALADPAIGTGRHARAIEGLRVALAAAPQPTLDIDALVDAAYNNNSGLFWDDDGSMVLDNIKADLREAYARLGQPTEARAEAKAATIAAIREAVERAAGIGVGDTYNSVAVGTVDLSAVLAILDDEAKR